MLKPTLAVALIVKNEEKHLAACLDTVKGWVDEIVILDSGSQDQTEMIARRYTDKFYQNLNWQGFGKQRQLAQQYVASDYVLWLDADERITPELQRAIQQTVTADKPNTLYQIGRCSEVFGREIRHSGWYPDWVLRLYRTSTTQYNNSLVHEKVIEPVGFQIEKLSGDLRHYTYENLHHYLTKSAFYAQAWAEQRQKAGKQASLSQGVIHAISCFIKMYLLKRGFLDGKQGFLLAVLSAHSTFIKYADLWIRSQTKTKN
ncbi:glycosyltransferase family 2 protein [Testudinibacter sp. TR-2022]|uniref:glycosyltransferase family 2 protein n=1 Tax=Testudinibacter sp. TR-2022 TaxID=2585029 RepID=UPI00111AF67D|nr:glycosyltransferase family 2 protein [Testudinibacter sp. TR-2022]TNH07022.1 glycosyltransferase family 2 protein [Pasteurellaceae bacterium Phil11]TNH21763.1 glycosyltransferase family 2 protein [Testudinibacter sp. TR-2022]TNH29076.1 glycosyltransferase family 2 protein [Testudinibacter sp. TR-2022]